MYIFLHSQIKEIVRGGLPVFLRKLYNLLLLPLVVPVVLIVRALRPLVVIRFGFLFSARIGHFALNTEIYLCKRDLRMFEKKVFDIFYYNMPICNYQLKKMWDRTLHISPFPRFTYLVDRINRLIPGYQRHLIPLEDSRDLNGFYVRLPAHLAFSTKEERFGQKALKKLGITDGSPFVCFHARDSVYLNTVNPVYNWYYHNFRDSDIRNYISAMEELIRRGYFAIRMGAKIKEPLATNNSMIIDYATKHRTDFLDIYLGAKCKFFVGCGSGIDEIPKIFRGPVVYVNFIPLNDVPFENLVRLFITKKLWLRKESRFMSFREILDSGVGGFLRFEQYERLGIDTIENTPQEIFDVVIEMDERLKGTWVETEEDRELQHCFWSLFKPDKLRGKIFARMGAEFLRQNRKLLK